VVSSDATVLQAAATAGAHPLPDTTADLNAALHLAQASAEQAGAEALLIIPADVPLLTPADGVALVAALAAGRASVAGSQAAGVIVPSHDGSGTNALGITLPSPLPFQFGSSSFAHHQESARRLGIHLHVHTSPTLALDIDTPADLAQLEHEQQHRERKERDGNHWICCGT
jgi:2-phospho-L-lactate guanylyltransferase